jgi:hypothetical protein
MYVYIRIRNSHIASQTKMAVTLLFVLITVAGLATGRDFYLYNHLGYTIWVAMQGIGDMPQPSNGSFTMFPDVGVRNQVKICGCGT